MHGVITKDPGRYSAPRRRVAQTYNENVGREKEWRPTNGIKANLRLRLDHLSGSFSEERTIMLVISMFYEWRDESV